MKARLDAQVGFWSYDEESYPWLSEQPILRQDYLPAHVEPFLVENGFHGAIAVQSRNTLEETDFLLEQMETCNQIMGVVGWTDLTADNLLATLSRYQGRVTGFRHPLDGVSPEYLFSDAFLRGIRLLADFGYTFDLSATPDQLPDCLRLVDQFPEQPFVLNQLGKPEFTDEGFETWSGNFKALAERPNVFCKMSGLFSGPFTEDDPGEWQEDFLKVDALLPFVECALESFTPDRLMYASDWPNSTLQATYDEICDIAMACIEHLSTSEQESVMGNTAARFYNITGLS